VDPRRSIRVLGASQHNLRDLDVEIPLGVFVAVTGVSGSGKSTLIMRTFCTERSLAISIERVIPGEHKSITGLEHIDKVIDIDQSPIGRTPSNPATYTGLFTPIRGSSRRCPRRRSAAMVRVDSRST
jgi:excinuclease ABC subunit A